MMMASSQLDSTIFESIKAGLDADTIIEMFDRKYADTIYPPIAVFKTLFLCSAVDMEHQTLLYRLLDSGSYDVNYNFGYVTPSPLNIAVRISRTDFIVKLLECDASVNQENRFTLETSDEVVTAIQLSVMLDRCDLLKLMIPFYDRLQTRTKRSTLHLACLHGSRQCLEYILSTAEGKNDINTTDSDDVHQPEGFSPLMLGLHQGSWLVRTILEHGGSATHVTGRLQYNALQLACSPNLYRGYQFHGFVCRDLPDVICLLVDAGCCTNDTDSHGNTPLSLLCTQVRHQLNTRKDVPYPYDFSIHRQVVLSSATSLLDKGAGPDACLNHLPLSVLIDQLFSIVQPISSVRLNQEIERIFIPSAIEATTLARDLFQLLLSRGANPNIKDVYSRVSPSLVESVLLVLIRNCRHGDWESGDDGLSSILIIFVDIFRLLLLFGAELSKPELTIQLFQLGVPHSLTFISLLFNYLDETQFMMYHNQLLQTTNHSNDDDYLQKRFPRRPRSLKQIARVKIIHSFGGRGFKEISSLDLPKALEEYILTLLVS